MSRINFSAFHWMHRVSATTGVILGLAISAGAQAVPRITTAVKDSALVTLKGNTLPVATALNDRGRLSDDTSTGRMLMVLKHSDDQQAALDRLVSAQATPGSPQFHKWLTPTQYASQFGVADADIQTVTAYLADHGFSVTQVYPNKMAIEFSGNAGQVRSTFKTELHTFAANGHTFIANDRDPQIPAALGKVVSGFASLNNYRAAVAATRTAPLVQRTKAHPQYDNFPPGNNPDNETLDVSPGDLAAIYNIPTTATGSGVSVGVVATSNINVTYLNNYQKTFGLSVKNPTIVVDGEDPGETADAFDPLVQLELISAVAPSSSLYLYTTATTDPTDGLNYALIRAVNDNKVQVLVYDAENCEANLGVDGGNQFINFSVEQAAAQGMTVIAGSGNGGSDSCQANNAFGNTQALAAVTTGLSVNGYATPPFVTAVGATDFYYPVTYPDPAEALVYWNTTNSGTAGYTSAKGYIPEQPFNYSDGDTNYYGSYGVALATGGGISTLGLGTSGYPMPSWQIPVLSKSSDPAVAAAANSATGGRTIPDVSMFGGGGGNASSYMLCYQASDCVNSSPGYGNITYESFSGPNTSSATFAGVAALVVQKHGAQGNINPTLYSLYQSANAAAIFHAPAAGTNTVACVTGSPDCGSANYLVESTGGPLAYQATTSGYNAAVGLGSVNVGNLITDWAAPATALTNTTFTLTQLNTTTPVTSFVHGTALQENIAVTSGSGTPTGDVAILASSALPLNTGIIFDTLSGGVATDTTRSSALPGGTYKLYARYAGDGATFAPSVSTPLTVTVTPETSRINITSSIPTGSSIAFGSAFSISAFVGSATNTLSVGNPTGSVQVSDTNSNGMTQVINVPLDATNHAIFTGPLAVGQHTLSFSYPGDLSYQASTAPSSFTLTVGSQITATALSSTSTNDPKKGYIQLVAVVSAVGGSTAGVGPLGTVTFTSAGSTVSVLGTATLVAGTNASGIVAGVANLQLAGSKIPAGTTGVIATYNPIVGSNFSSSSSTPLSLTTTAGGGTTASTTALVTADGYSSYFNYAGSVSFNVTVSGSGAKPTGTVSLFSNGAPIGTATLANGTGTLIVSDDPNTGLLPTAFTVGKDLITAQYSGDGTYATSTKELTISILSEGTLPDFGLVSNTNYGTLSATSTSAAFTLTLNSVNNFAALGYNISFSAAVPAGIACTFGGTPLKFTSTATYLTNTVTCTGATGYTVAHADPAQAPLQRFWIASGGAAFACVFLLGIPARRKNWKGMLGAMVLVVLGLGAAGSLTACGGNSMAAVARSALDGSSDAKTGTAAATKTLAAGNYQVLITVKSNFASGLNTTHTATTQTHTIPLEITVQ